MKKVLGNLTPFHIYYGRTHFSAKAIALENKDIKRKIKNANKSFRLKIMRKTRLPSKYMVGESVWLRYPRRHIIYGRILDVNKAGSRYLVVVKSSKRQRRTSDMVREWIVVENITSTTIQKQKQNKAHNIPDRSNSKGMEAMRKWHRKRFYQDLSHDDHLQSFQPDVFVLFDAPLSHQLKLIGIHRDAHTLRQEPFEHLRRNQMFY